MPFPEPTADLGSRAEVLLCYLDFYRDRLVAKTGGLPERELRHSRLPSGWSPIELVKHLRHVERRWLEWGFAGLDVGDPWADQHDGRWYVPAEETLPELVAALHEQAWRSRSIVAAHALAEVGKPGLRWDGAEPATLERILLHLLQEYARHVGHLDIVVELACGATGE
jgi:hypothetical protein